MKKLSANGIIVCAGLLMTGITSAINAGTAQSIISAPKQNFQNISYTSSGKTDRKTAMLFQQLMKNNKGLEVHAKVLRKPAPSQNYQNFSYSARGKTDRKTALLFQQLMKNNKDLEVHAEITRMPSSNRNRQVEVAVNYTVHGKTSMNNLKKLIKLFQTSKEVHVSATANVRTNNTAKRNPKQDRPQQQRNPNLYNNADSAFVFNNNPANYYPTFYYPGYPPVYIQGNTMWIPVPIEPQQYQTAYLEPPFPMDYSSSIAKK